MAKLKKYSIIIAVDEKHGIWKDNSIPWKLKNDLQFFKTTTITTKSKKKQNVVIMWRKTWESLPQSVRPLPWRVNYILSSWYKENPTINADGSFGFNSFESAHEYASSQKDIEGIFIIGGSYLYNLVLDSEDLQQIYLTRVYGDFNCDVFMWKIPSHFKITTTSEKQKEWDIEYQMFTYKNKKSLLMQFLSPFYLFLGALFIILLWYLLYVSFWNTQTPPPSPVVTEENITPEPEIIIPKEQIQEPLPQKKEESQTSPTDEDKIQQETTDNTDIPKRTESIGSVTIYYPETGLRSVDRQIQDYIKKKKILYKILVHNASLESETPKEIILDYEILSETPKEIQIQFSDSRNGNEVESETITIKKQ
jgi:dihydrofolate reductase